MTNEKAIMCLEDMKIKVPIPKAAKQARENNEALDVAIKALQSAEPKKLRTIDIIRAMNEDELVEWLCKQMWQDYGKNQMLSAIRFHQVRNFLLMEVDNGHR